MSQKNPVLPQRTPQEEADRIERLRQLRREAYDRDLPIIAETDRLLAEHDTELEADEEQGMLHEISAEQAEDPLTADELAENARIILAERRNQPKKH